MGNFWYQVTNGQSFFIKARFTTRTIPGKGFCGAHFWSQCESLLWPLFYICQADFTLNNQTFKHIFTSPSSVEKEAKATRSGNARIHGMTQVTRASIAYAATQVRIIIFFSLPFTPLVGCRRDLLWRRQPYSHVLIP